MQATDLFLGLIANSGVNSSETLPRKADLLPQGDGSFKQMFTKAVDKPAESSITPYAKSSAMRTEVKEVTRSESPVSNAAEQRTAEKPAAYETAVKPKARMDSSYSNKADAGAKTADAGKTVKDSDTAATDSKVAAESANKPDNASEIVEKLEALIDKLEQEAENLDPTDEAELAELIVSLLALLLKDQQAAENGDTDSSEMAVRLNLDPDGALAKLLDVLMADEGVLDAAALEDVNVLLKLTDEKGLLIPLSEIVKYDESQEGDAAHFSVQFAEANGETVTLDLSISAQDVKNAQIVNLAQAPLDESELVMTIPLEKLAQASGLDDLEALAAKLQQQGADGKMAKLLDALGLSGKELAETIAAKESAQQELKVATPIPTSSDGEQAQKPMIATADSLYLQTDQAMKSMEAEALAKEVTGLTQDRKELFDRLYKLLSEMEGKSENFSSTLISKSGGSFFTMDWLGDFSGQGNQDSQQWTSDLFGDTLAEKASFIDTMNTANASADRISFIGRSADTGNTLNQVLTDKAETAQQSSTRGNDVHDMVMKQVVQRISYQVVNGTEGEVRVALRPDTLGEMTLKVRTDQDVVLAKITAHSHEVKAIIESNLDQLKSALQEQGVKVGSFEVTVDTGSGDAQNGAEDHTGDDYLSQYATGLEEDGLDAGALPELFEGDYAYSRAGSTPGSVSKHSYLA